MQTVAVARRPFGVLCVTGATVVSSTFGFFIVSVFADTPTGPVWGGFFGASSVLLLLVFREGLSGFRRLGWMGWAFGACGGLGV